MPLPASGELSHPDNQDVDMKAYLEALRDEVASLSSQLNTVQIDLEAAEQAIVSNDGDITTLDTNKLEASDLADYEKKILTSNATLVWSGSSTDIAAGSITGGIIAGTYIFEIGGAQLTHMTLINVTGTTEVVYGVSNTGSGIGIQTIEHTLLSGSRFRIYQKTIGGTTPTYTTTSPVNLTKIWRM
jgi:hypothetical protein